LTDPSSLQALGAGDFEPRRGETFRMRTTGGTEDLVLLEVARLAPATEAPGGRRGAFSLVFRSPLASHVPQAMYTLEHASLGALELFLVPIGPRDGGMCYEAIFN
jgi:Domain of unknown function (DUF6916)